MLTKWNYERWGSQTLPLCFIMKNLFTLLVILSNSFVSAQDVNIETLDKIFTEGKSYIEPLKNGQIEHLKNVKPPKDTWVFSKLEDYKQNLGSDQILYGSIIMPGVNDSTYSYNLFAYDIKREAYYFVAIVSYDVLENDVKFDNAFLFTEERSLKDWWSTTFKFYQSEKIKTISKEYIFEICPPPPFKD